MARIHKYPLDTNVTQDDYVIGTDAESSFKATKNFKVSDLAKVINEVNSEIPSDGSWVYRFNADTPLPYGDFYTPGFDFNGGEDATISNLTEMFISNKTFSGAEADKLLQLAGQPGVVIFLVNKNDYNNYFLIKDPNIITLSGVQGYTKITFTDTFWSKSFNKGDEYGIRFMFTSNFTPDLYKESNNSSVDNPTTPPEGGVHIGKKDKVQVLKDKIIFDDDYIFLTSDLFTNLASSQKPTDPNTIRNFRVVAIGNDGRIYPLEWGDTQSDWIENNKNNRYHIKNRFAQKEISSTYTLTASDNGHTIFVNNGAGDVTININPNLTGFEDFRYCKIIQMGKGKVDVRMDLANDTLFEVRSPVVGNLIGGQFRHGKLTRQVITVAGVTTYGDFYLDVSGGGGVSWSTESI